MSPSDSASYVVRKTDRVLWLLVAFYIVASSVEIYAEYLGQPQFIYIVKPLIIPTLILIYCRTSPSINQIYIIALIFSWIANIFFIRQTFASIFAGAIFFFFYRVSIIYVVIRHIRLPGIFPIAVGCVPFLFVYLYLVNITYKILGDGLLIFVIQCLVVSLLGGLSVGNFMLRSNRAAKFLLFSTLLFAITQFIFVFRLYYDGERLFQPLAMFLFVVAQYVFYRFMILSEREKSGKHAESQVD